jgi:quercetin dioxygenase-like cupin family protein
MMRTTVIACAALLTACAAEPERSHVLGDSGRQLSDQERAEAQVKAGPIANRGIEKVSNIGSVPLANEVPGVGNRALRVREILVAEKGVLGTHRHEQQPGFVYVLEGELTEVRSDNVKPITHGPGSVAFEWTGVAHYWENRGDDPARVLLVDIVPDAVK